MNGATLTTVISFVSNTLLSIAAGLFFYRESFAIMKLVGMLFVWNGIYILEKEKHKKKDWV